MDLALKEKLEEVLGRKEFVYVATSDEKSRPSAAPKFLLRAEEGFLYLVDHVFGRTYENLKSNPHISITTMDRNSLLGYQMNGTAEIVDRGPEFEEIVEELRKKQVRLTTERVIEAVRMGKTHEDFEVSFPKEFVVFKVKIENIIEISPKGGIARQEMEKRDAPSAGGLGI